MENKQQQLRITMPDGSKYDVPVGIIALNRAAYYANVDACTEAEALDETTELFNSCEDEILDWASNNMNWEDMEDHAKRVVPAPMLELSEAWGSGECELRVVEA